MSLARNKKNKGKKLGIVVLSTPPYSCQHQCIHKTINIKYRTCRFILGKALHWVSVVCFWQSYFFGWDLGRCQYAGLPAQLQPFILEHHYFKGQCDMTRVPENWAIWWLKYSGIMKKSSFSVLVSQRKEKDVLVCSLAAASPLRNHAAQLAIIK